MRSIPFRCLKCGECCKHLAGRRFGMVLTPAEYRRLNRLARLHGTRLDAVPLVGGVIGARLYQMTHDVCPFLDRRRNRCKIYEQRPIVCRMFPLHPAGLMSCTALTQLTRLGLPVEFPADMKRAATEYLLTVHPIIKGADLVYSLDNGWKPKNWYTFKPKPGV